MKWTIPFERVTLADIARVGGKNASIGQMTAQLSDLQIRVPRGFALTVEAYWHFIDANNLREKITHELSRLTDVQNINQLQQVGEAVRQLIVQGTMPEDVVKEIATAYAELSRTYKSDAIDVAIRSSATAEDLPTASFAGQQESYLNVRGLDEVVASCIKCFASLFTDRALVYRVENGFPHMAVGLSVGIQKMVRSDLAAAGVAFSLDPESGFPEVVTINASYGLGEAVVKGMVVPDEFVVHKPTLAQGYASLIRSTRGGKKIKIIYASGTQQTQTVAVDEKDQQVFALTDQEVLDLARSVVAIEKEYSADAKAWKPMDIEWAKDGVDGLMYIVQARPETIHAHASRVHITTYQLEPAAGAKPRVITTGFSIGQRIATGNACIITGAHELNRIQDGQVLVADMTDPDWVPAMKKASAIVTNRGGRTCHAAIVSRELGIPAIVGTGNATEIINPGQQITVDCSAGEKGTVYDGAVPFKEQTVDLEKLPKPPVPVMLNIAQPDTAFTQAWLPVSGVGLARIEFIVSTSIKVHPMVLIHPELVTDENVRKQIDQVTAGFDDKKEFFVRMLSQGIATIAAAFYPRPVIVRLSDFKSNEYRNLIGGQFLEPVEENPMIGLRGAFRYYYPAYQEAFALECAALLRARDTFGLQNIKVMVPFVRTVTEASKVVEALARNGIKRGVNKLELVMMCEVPSNVILIKDFSRFFDGFSIGSNDLTQLTLGVDRDSGLLGAAFDERDPAVMKMMEMAIVGAHAQKKFIGICGQAPSDYPEIAQQLVAWGIDSISLNPDAVVPFYFAMKSLGK